MTNELVMPVILEARRNADSTISTISNMSESHVPVYTIGILSIGHAIINRFQELELIETRNLFYAHNQQLKTIHLWKLIEKTIRPLKESAKEVPKVPGYLL
jgi:hypothetical protein